MASRSCETARLLSEPEPTLPPPADAADDLPASGGSDFAAPPRADYVRGATGAMAAVIVCALLVGGLWLAARNAPSAATDPRLLPAVVTPTGRVPPSPTSVSIVLIPATATP